MMENACQPGTPASVSALRRAINSGDAREVAGCFSTDYVATTPLRPSGSFVGNAQVLHNWESLFNRIVGVRAEVLRYAVSAADIWSEWWITGTTADGVQVQLGGPVIWRELGGKIVRARFYLDQVTPRDSQTDRLRAARRRLERASAPRSPFGSAHVGLDEKAWGNP